MHLLATRMRVLATETLLFRGETRLSPTKRGVPRGKPRLSVTETRLRANAGLLFAERPHPLQPPALV
jgi:hypothetical protein